MISFAYYPFFLIIFWYKDVIGSFYNFFIDCNRYVASLLSLSLLTRTFFKPLKNEYRDGLVIFSILFGIAIKSVLISVSLLIIFCILFVEFMVGIFLLALPLLLIALMFGKVN